MFDRCYSKEKSHEDALQYYCRTEHEQHHFAEYSSDLRRKFDGPG